MLSPTKTAKPFSSDEKLKRSPLKGLYSAMSDEAEVPTPGVEDEAAETDHYAATEEALDTAESAIDSGDTEAAKDAIASAREHLAQCQDQSGQEA